MAARDPELIGALAATAKGGAPMYSPAFLWLYRNYCPELIAKLDDPLVSWQGLSDYLWSLNIGDRTGKQASVRTLQQAWRRVKQRKTRPDASNDATVYSTKTLPPFTNTNPSPSISSPRIVITPAKLRE